MTRQGRASIAGNRQERLWPRLLAALVLFCILASLGTWQLHRLAWKEQLVASVNSRITEPPRPLEKIEEMFAATGDVDYWPVEASGHFLNDRESHFLATWQGRPGFFVYTPLQLADERFVLVNRGFVPSERKDTASRPESLAETNHGINGLARNPLAKKPSWLVPENDAAKNIFYWKDLEAMAARAGIPAGNLVPFFIDAGDAPNPGGLPIGGVTLIAFPNNHLQYALTWYGLAAALAAVFASWLVKRRRTGGL